MKNEIIIGDVRHVLVRNPYPAYPCRFCSLSNLCQTSICKELFGAEEAHFELLSKKMNNGERYHLNGNKHVLVPSYDEDVCSRCSLNGECSWKNDTICNFVFGEPEGYHFLKSE